MVSGMRVEVDKERCVGAGMCALTAPDVFTQDDDGFSEMLPGRPAGTGTTRWYGRPYGPARSGRCP